MRGVGLVLTLLVLCSYPILAWAGIDRRLLCAQPILVNSALFLRFGASLFQGRMPTVECFARMRAKEFSTARVSYCRTVTKVWCGFFLLNGCIVCAVALIENLAAWRSYVGTLGYLAIGVLFAGEYAVRRIRFG